MLIKNFITLSLAIFSLFSYAQDNFSPFCERAEKDADSLLSNNIIYFPRIVSSSSLTLRKMLEIEHGIKDELYDNGSDMSFGNERECFYTKMKLEIERKWGDQFLEQKKTEADQLDKEGLGFTEPFENGITAFLESQLKGSKLDYDGYYVNFDIGSNGAINSFDILSGVPVAFQITPNSTDYNIISNAVRTFDQKLIPATLRGNPVTSELTIWIEL